MHELLQRGARAATLLTARGERIVVAETSAGGLVSAALLAVPGASTFYVGGAITYSARAIRTLVGLTLDELQAAGIRSSSEPYAALLARTIRARHDAQKVTWGLSETGAAGPDGNRYGDPAGHTCMAVCGPVTRVRTMRTGRADRFDNMQAFAIATLELLIEALEAANASP